METKFSFVMPVYGGYQKIGRALDSISAQTDSSYEIIVVNDGKDPLMQAAVEAMFPQTNKPKQAIRAKQPIVTYMENGHVGRRGGFMSIDIGISFAQGTFTCILNGDNTIRSDYVEKMYHPEAHVLKCWVKMNDMQGIIIDGTSHAKGRVDRLNYAFLTETAQKIGYQKFTMNQDDWYFFVACYQYLLSKGEVIEHNAGCVLAEHF